MDYNARNTALERLGRLGKAGGVPIDSSNPKPSIDDLQRRSSTVSQVLAELLSDHFRGPRSGEGADIFTIDCRSGGNLMNTAEAVLEGFGSIDNLAIFRHGRGFVLDYYVVIRHVLNNPSPAGPNPPNRMGGIQLYAVDDNRTVFQVDADAESQEAIITVSCWSSKTIPANGISPEKTGASRGRNGFILATKL